jgi:hypothetical protein
LTELEQLQATRDLITDENNFTQHAMARDHEGAHCRPSSRQASCWCVTGAWLHVNEYRRSYVSLKKLCNGLNVYSINDEFGHAAVLAMLDRAIAKQDT